MYSQAFTLENLKKMLRHSDYFRQKNLSEEDDEILKEALDKSIKKEALTGADVTVHELKKKNKIKYIYSLKNFSDKILMRKVAHNILTTYKVTPTSRDSIIKNLKKILEENVTYRIYRRDIKNFYGSVSSLHATSKLEKNWKVSRPTVSLTRSLLSFFRGREEGLPRGLQISAALAEVSMQDFDATVKQHPDVFLYARFVDDIIVITSGAEDILQFDGFLSQSLPSGLVFNSARKKKYTMRVNARKKGITSTSTAIQPNAKFQFLGYFFKIYPSQAKEVKKRPHELKVSISDDKIKRIKTKTVKAFLSYLKDRNFMLLQNRIKLLTGNYYLLDKDRNRKRMAGIYYSNLHVTDAEESLRVLDKFLFNLISSGRGKVSRGIKFSLSAQERRILLGHKFSRGYAKKTIHYFNKYELIAITRCWKNG